MMLYDDLKQFINDKRYTVLECQSMLNNYYKHKQLTDDEYDELMELSKELEANNSNDDLMMIINKIKHDINALKKDVETLKSESGAPPQETEDGTQENPFIAYRGMTYIKDKYYLDTEDNSIYLCTRNDITGGQQLNYLPHELKDIYFQFIKKDE